MTADLQTIRDRAVADLAAIRQQIEPLASNVQRLRTDVGRAEAERDQLLRQRTYAVDRVEGTIAGVVTAQEALRLAEHIAAGARADLTAIDTRLHATTARTAELSTAYCRAAATLADVDPQSVHLCHCHQYDGQPHAPHPGTDPYEQL